MKIRWAGPGVLKMANGKDIKVGSQFDSGAIEKDRLIQLMNKGRIVDVPRSLLEEKKTESSGQRGRPKGTSK